MTKELQELNNFIKSDYLPELEDVKDAAKELVRKRGDLTAAGDQLKREAGDVVNVGKAIVKSPYKIKKGVAKVQNKLRQSKMNRYQKKIDKLQSKAELGSMKRKYKIAKSASKRDHRNLKSNQKHNRYVSKVKMRGL